MRALAQQACKGVRRGGPLFVCVMHKKKGPAEAGPIRSAAVTSSPDHHTLATESVMSKTNVISRARIAWRVAIAVWLLIGIYLAITAWWTDIKRTKNLVRDFFSDRQVDKTRETSNSHSTK